MRVPAHLFRAGGTRRGWGWPSAPRDRGGLLVVYHGVRDTVAGGLYRAGLALPDHENPSVVVRRSDEWALGPSADYEVTGDVPSVVFPCGLVRDENTDRLSPW